MTPFRFLTFFIIGLTLSIPSFANVQKAWEHFANNQLTESIAAFEAAKKGQDKDEALLGLTLAYAASADDQKSFEAYYEFIKSAENPEPYLKALWTLSVGEKSESELSFLKEMTKFPNGSIQCLAHQALGYHYQSISDFEQADEHFDAVGAVRKWKLLGEFENISESGFHKDFGVVDHPEVDHDFLNKRGVPIRWFNLKQARQDNWIDFSFHFYFKNSIIYAQNWCNSPEKQDVQFRIGTSGSLKVWVNDELRFSEERERNNDLDTYIFPVSLEAGNNRILVQIGESETDNSNFLLRITDDKGFNIPGLTYDIAPQKYPKKNGQQLLEVKDETELFFQSQLKKDPKNLPAYLALAQYYLHNDKTYPAKQILKDAREHFRNCSYLTFQLIDTYLRDDNRTGLSGLIEELKQKDPDNALAQELMYSDAVKLQNYPEAQSILKRIEAREGSSANVLNKKIELASVNKEIEKMMKLVDEAYTEYPSDYDFVLLKYYIEKDVKKNAQQAAKILEKYLKKHYNEEAMTLLAGCYFDLGEVEKGISQYTTLISNKPIATGYLSELAAIYFNLGMYQKSEELTKKCIEIAPYVGTYYKTLAENYAEMEKPKESVESYRRSIELNPYDYEAREQLRRLEEKPDIFAYFHQPDIYKLVEESPSPDSYKEDASIILLDEVQKVVYDGGGSEERYILLVKVFNSTGVDDWKEYHIPIYNNQKGLIEKAEVIKKNGTRVTAQNQGTHIVFPNLEEGDAIHLSYRLRNFYTGKLANQFWGKHYFAYFLPVKESRYQLLIPKGRDFQYKSLNTDIKPQILQRGLDYSLYKWEMLDVASLSYEPYMSTLADVSASLHISSIPDWSYVIDWYESLARAKSKVDFEVKELTDDLFKGKENLSDYEKVQEIYNYIVHNIRYMSVPFLQSGLVPQKAARVVVTKQGDCKDVSTLFVSMCATQGIDANLVLVNTRDNGYNDIALPSIDFNHCIARVKIDNEEYYVELTAENLPFSSSMYSLKNVFALNIDTDATGQGATLIDPTTRVSNEVIRESDITFDMDNMIVEKDCKKTGINAAFMRNSYEYSGAETQFKDMQEAISTDYPNIKLLDVAFTEGLDNTSKELDYRYKYLVPSIFTNISGLSIFRLPWADAVFSPEFISAEKRKYPIELWEFFYSEFYEEKLWIHIPAGKKLSEIPKTEKYQNDYFEYEMRFEDHGDKLLAIRSFRVLKDIVSASDYPEFKQTLAKVVKSDNRSLAFMDQ